MRGSRISPEKITHPFQLMAAWFVMLLVLVSLLLAAADKIASPAWASGFLVISAVVLSILVMSAVFLVLTMFRPHLQGPKEYAEWLKDERRFVAYATQRVETREVSTTSGHFLQVQAERSEEFSKLGEDTGTAIEIVRLRGFQKVLQALNAVGFRAHIYESELDPKRMFSSQGHAAIWVGSRVPSGEAILTIKAVVRVWPHLRYLHLSGDSGAPPDEIHDQMFFGGSTSTANEYGLQRWTSEELEAIPDNLDSRSFHQLVRSKYGSASVAPLSPLSADGVDIDEED